VGVPICQNYNNLVSVIFEGVRKMIVIGKSEAFFFTFLGVKFYPRVNLAPWGELDP
jgi:hypothetical protein